MSSTARVLLGILGAALLLLALVSAFAVGVAWSPQDRQGTERGPGWDSRMGRDDNGMMGQGGGMMDRGGMMDGDAADAMFLRMMIPHHEQAIEMSRVALSEAEHSEIRHLAEQIIAEQSAEIKL